MSIERNILLVEDESADALLIKRALEKTGLDFKLSRLKHGDEAIDYLSGTPPFQDRETHPLPDVILLDIKLPRRTGFEVLEWVRSQAPGISRIPVVMLTSSRHSVDVNRAYDLRANGYLTKPDTANRLQEMMVDFKKYWLRWNEQPEIKTGSDRWMT
ncbi:MAG TPA: response regulator [Terriglobales bacterium]|nr:response regulator [Terriglobales bacterium]